MTVIPFIYGSQIEADKIADKIPCWVQLALTYLFFWSPIAVTILVHLIAVTIFNRDLSSGKIRIMPLILLKPKKPEKPTYVV